MHATPHIGILAGMGPRSTAPFVDLVVSECQRQYGARDDIDFPPMMVYSLPTPFFLDRPLDHAALEASIRAGLAHLASTGVALVAMPCNTAHRYHAALAASIGVPLLDMVALAAEATPEGAGPIALLATRATVEAQLYQPALAARGLACHHSESLQRHVDGVIHAVKQRGPAEVLPAWRALAGALRDARAGAALIACTDLNVALALEPLPCAVVDATRLLAAATVARWRELRDLG